MSGWPHEPEIVVNGHRLTDAQASAVRVAIASWNPSAHEELYRARLEEVERLMFPERIIQFPLINKPRYEIGEEGEMIEKEPAYIDMNNILLRLKSSQTFKPSLCQSRARKLG